jgi:hypothetical protein
MKVRDKNYSVTAQMFVLSVVLTTSTQLRQELFHNKEISVHKHHKCGLTTQHNNNSNYNNATYLIYKVVNNAAEMVIE